MKQITTARKLIQTIALSLTFCCTALMGSIGYLDDVLPERYYVNQGDSLSLSQSYLSCSKSASANEPVSANTANGTEVVKFLGVIPVKTVSVQNTNEVSLIPSGDTFGVKMFTQGAMVVGLSSIKTVDGEQSPGKQAGLEEGDLILKVNGKEITRNEEVAYIIENSEGKPIQFTVQRNSKTFESTLTPVLSSDDGKYKSGVWIRDSAAGIGTITFIDPLTNAFAGLGHGICDVDTGQILPVGSGEVCEVSIHSIHKGKSGTPGELMGAFVSNDAIGNIVNNNSTGIYGTLFSAQSQQESYPLAHKQEVQLGEATILCTLKDDTAKEYRIEITSLDYNENNEIKNMVIKVVDEDLIAQTGGIVQGMSGTPILQNGKLVGAVTHVFVNNPLKGYGIFAENMYEYSSKIEAS